jgi:hypothetical protein
LEIRDDVGRTNDRAALVLHMSGQSGVRTNGASRRARSGDDGRLFDLHLEGQVLGACLLVPDLINATELTTSDFYSESNGVIWSALVYLKAEGELVDPNTLQARLVDTGQFQRVGGLDYLLGLTDQVIPVPFLLDRLHRLGVERRMQMAAAQLAACAGRVSPAELEPYFDALLKHRTELDELLGVAKKITHRFDSLWQTVGERGSLEKMPAPRRWLLSRPDDDTNRMGNPIGVLPLGKTGLLVAQGGSGKTIALIQLAISVATGRKWLDYFFVPQPGRVLLALAEEDGEELDRRIYDLSGSMRLTDAQRELVGRNVIALGLSGEVTSLVTQDGRETIETDVLTYFRRRLSEGEWSLVVLDTLTRFAGGDTEKDAAQATRFIQAAESLCKVPGRPAVLIAHHTNKISRAEGAATSAANARGSSALTDGARWVANLEGVSDESVKLTITKSNYAMGCPVVMLARDAANGGCLSVESPEVARLRAEQTRAGHDHDRWEAMRLRILAALEQPEPLRSRGEVAIRVGGRRAEALAVLRDLIEAGAVSHVEGVYRVVGKEVS